MPDRSPTKCARRITNAIGLLELRLEGHRSMHPDVSSVDLCRMLLLDAATLLAHFIEEDE